MCFFSLIWCPLLLYSAPTVHAHFVLSHGSQSIMVFLALKILIYNLSYKISISAINLKLSGISAQYFDSQYENDGCESVETENND